MLDIPCGDFLFMEQFLKNKNIKYIGGDIVEELIKNNNGNTKITNLKFLTLLTTIKLINLIFFT